MRKTFEDKGCACDIIELDGGYILLSGYPDFECDGRFFLFRWTKREGAVGKPITELVLIWPGLLTAALQSPAVKTAIYCF